MKIRMLQNSVVVLLSILSFSSVALAAGAIDLPQTGQTTCYNSNGDDISCANTGQDGDWQAGVRWPNPRFVSGTGSEADCMIDKLTGLMWPKNGNLAGGRKTWQAALNYANGLTTLCGHSDWRLPNIVELRSLVNDEESDVAAWLNTQGFNNVQSSNYWSSTSYSDVTHYAWIVNMWDGLVDAGYKGYDDSYVWPVRGGQSGSFGNSAVDLPRTGQTKCYNSGGWVIDCADTGQDGELQMGVAWPSPRYSVSGECVTDNLTGLMWTKDANRFGSQTWQTALNYAGGPNLCGFTDWRLPNVTELRSVVDYSNYDPALPDSRPFTNVQSSYYWSSTSYSSGTYYAWIVHMWVGYVGADYKDDNGYYVWPVRGGQFGNSDISVILSATPDPVEMGQQVTYTAIVKNNGPDATNAITVEDSLPAGVTFVSATSAKGTCANAAGVVTCSLSGLNKGSSATVAIVVTAPATQGVIITNTVKVSSHNKDGNLANNTATTTTTIHGMLLDLTPKTLTTASATAQNLTATYTHTKGVADLKTVEFLVSLNGGLASGIRLKYDRAANTISIYGNTGTTISGSCTPGSAQTISNSQGALNCAATKVSQTATYIIINWNITPSALFASSTSRKVSLKATDTAAKIIDWTILGDWKITSSNTAPTLGTISPAASTGATKTFTAIYSDPDGFANLKQVDLLVSSDGSSVNAIRARYDRSSDSLMLFNDIGSGFVSGSCFPGDTDSLSNSQGTLNCAKTTVSGTGNELTVKWNITAKAPFADTTPKQLLMAAWDYSDATTGLVRKGTWTINTAPTLGTVSPATATSNAGAAKAFTAIYSDANGNADLKTLEFLVSTDGGPANAIYLVYDRAADKLRMYDDAGATLLADSCAPASAGTISNAQGSLNCGKTTVTPSGKDITVKWSIKPKAAFAEIGNLKKIKTKATDNFGAATDLIQKATWTINTKPGIVSLDPETITSQQGEPKTLTGVYADGDGYTNLKNVEILIVPGAGTANGIRARYLPATDKLAIFDDAGAVVHQTCTKGKALAIYNTRGSIDCAATTVTKAGNNMTVNWSITPTAFFAAAAAKQVKLQATDNANATTGWVKKGEWTISSGPSLTSLTPTPITTLQNTLQTFTAVYSDPDGFANLATMEFLVSADGAKANAIYLKYDRAADKLLIYDNAGTTPVATTCAPATVGALTTNSQGTLDCAKTTVTKTGNDITINWAIKPKPAFASRTPKKLLMSATDATALTTGLKEKGSWTIIPTNTAPTLGTLTPLPVTSNVGTAQQFSATCSDVDGYANLKTMDLMISPSGIDPANSVWAVYNRTENRIHLKNDANTGYRAANCTPGEVKTIGNTRGSVNCQQVTINQTGNDLTVNWSITPKTIFAGLKNVWLNCTDNSGAEAGFTDKGDWTITP